MFLLASPQQSGAASAYWDANAATAGAGGPTPVGIWGTDTFWSADSTGSAATTSAWNPGDTAVFSAGTDATGAYTVTLNGTQSLSGINIEEGTLTLSGGGLSFGATGAPISVTSPGVATIASPISGAGTVGLIKTGTGTLVLSSVNTYATATAITGGILRLGVNNALPNVPLTVAGATFDLNGLNQTVSALKMGDGNAVGSPVVTGAGTLTINGDITYNSKPFSQTGPAIIASNISIPSGNHNITNVGSEISNDVYDVVVTGVISGAGSLTKAGTDSFVAVLTKANTYSGTTTVNNGILSLGIANCLPIASAITINTGSAITMPLFSYPGVTPGSYNQTWASLSGGGNLEIGGATFTIGGAGTSTAFSGQITDFGSSGSIIKVGAGTFTLSGANDYIGTTTINGGTLSVGAGATAGSLTSNLVNNAAVIFNRSDTSTFPGVLSGTGAVTKTGGGTLFLSATNTFTANPNVTGGALRAVDGVGLPTNVLLTLNGGSWEPTTATLTRVLGASAGQVRLTGGASGFSAFGQTLNVDVGGNGTGTGPALTWGNVNFNPSSFVLNAGTANAVLDLKNALVITAAASRTITVNANVATISGVISGTSPWTKNGNGALQLRNTANSFTGAVTVTAGILNLTTDAQLGVAPTAPTPAKITLNGGTLQAGGDFTLDPNRGIAIGANSATIATQGFNLTYTGAITGSNAITKSGAGTLTLGPSNSNYSGTWTMTQGGTLIAGSSGSLGNGTPANTITFNNATLLTTGPIVGVNRPIAIAAGGGIINTNGFDSTFAAVTGAASGAVTKSGSGTLTLTSVRISGTTATLNVSAGKLLLAPNGQAAGVSAVNATVINTGAGAQLDLTNTHLIDKTTGVGVSNGSVYTGLTGLIAAGRGTSPTWSGAGIITSQTDAAGSDRTTLGIATASQVESIGATNSAVWAGATVVGTDSLIMYTYGGDATLDGRINIDDYTRIDQGISTGVAGWYNGDFNYDGKINIDDYTIIDANIGNQSGQFFVTGGIDGGASGDFAGVSAVPEPAGVGMFILSATLLARRRSRRAVEPKAHG